MSVDPPWSQSPNDLDISKVPSRPRSKQRSLAMRLRSHEGFWSTSRRTTGSPLAPVGSGDEKTEGVVTKHHTSGVEITSQRSAWRRPRLASAQSCEPNQRSSRLGIPRDPALLASTAPVPRTRPTDVYPAFLSRVAFEFRHRVLLSDRQKNSVEYKNVFDGIEATDKLMIILNTDDRGLALRLGRALGAQRLFHDVTYEARLIDTSSEIYQFNLDPQDTLSCDTSRSESTQSSHSSVTDDSAPFKHLPHGVFTELTYCYVPTCVDSHPCYSYACPKRGVLDRPGMASRLSSSTTHMSLLRHSQQLWSERVPQAVQDTISMKERKRQEVIHELVMTERNFVLDLEYLREMWIKPLKEETSLPVDRRATFIESVFSNVMDIHRLNAQFADALEARQNEHPIVYQVGDIVLDYVMGLEPYVHYGARQHEARFAFEHERQSNPGFARFVEQTERHPASHKLELNGYLTKPTTRLGRYTLLLNEILKHTREDHPDHVFLFQSVEVIKQFLTRVNAEAGKSKNRFDLQRIQRYLRFKNKADEMDLKLLEDGRQVIKQGMLRKNASFDSTDYQVLLLDHYLVVAKVKTIHANEHYVIQKRPIPIELLDITLPEIQPRRLCHGNLVPVRATEELSLRASVDLSTLSGRSNDTMDDPLSMEVIKSGYPVCFQHLGRGDHGSVVLYAPSLVMRQPWVDAIQKQRAIKEQRMPIFRVAPLIDEHVLHVDTEIHHSVTFGGGQFYLLATDLGVYVGHNRLASSPRRVLVLEKVTQVQVLEAQQVLLVLADKTLWEYSLEVVNGRPNTGRPPEGRKVQMHVPFFHVGTSLQRTLVCIPRVSPLKSTITLYEPSKPEEHKRHSLIGRLAQHTRTSPLPNTTSDIHLKRFKDCYIPSEVWAMELSASQLLITCPRGMIMVDLHSNKPQQMLNPNDKQLLFVTEREKDDMSLGLRVPIKRIAVFRTPLGVFIVCYDGYAFLIDGKGNRVSPEFLIEWEGRPEAFAFSYPYVIAFQPSFIEIRNVLTGHLEQIIRGSLIRCLNNGHRAELNTIFGTMASLTNPSYQTVFQLQPLDDLPHTPQSL